MILELESLINVMLALLNEIGDIFLLNLNFVCLYWMLKWKNYLDRFVY